MSDDEQESIAVRARHIQQAMSDVIVTFRAINDEEATRFFNFFMDSINQGRAVTLTIEGNTGAAKVTH